MVDSKTHVISLDDFEIVRAMEKVEEEIKSEEYPQLSRKKSKRWK